MGIIIFRLFSKRIDSQCSQQSKNRMTNELPFAASKNRLALSLMRSALSSVDFSKLLLVFHHETSTEMLSKDIIAPKDTIPRVCHNPWRPEICKNSKIPHCDRHHCIRNNNIILLFQKRHPVRCLSPNVRFS